MWVLGLWCRWRPVLIYLIVLGEVLIGNAFRPIEVHSPDWFIWRDASRVAVQVQEHIWSTMCVSAKVVADASDFIDFRTTRTSGTLECRLGDYSQKSCTLRCIDGSRP